MMAVKHFIISPEKESVSKEHIEQIRKSGENILLSGDDQRFALNEKLMQEEDILKCVEGRVIIKVNDKSKDFHTFESGLTIRRERKFNEFNRRVAQPVNAIVIDSTYIPPKSEVLIHPNAIHDSYRIFNYKDNNSDVRYYSIAEEQCFAYFSGKEWLPLKEFDFALRVFVPYKGLISNIEPTQLKDTLFVTTGKLKNKVVKTLKACDYQIIFQDKTGREGNLIRFRPFGNEKQKLEEEAIAILGDETKKVLSGEYLVGIEIKDAKPINQWQKLLKS